MTRLLLNGVRKGFVEDLKIEGENVIVTLKVDNNIQIKEDAKFAVSMLDLMGGKKIEISQGTSQNEIDYDKLQEGLFYADVPQVMSMVGTFRDDFTTTISDIKITLTSLNNYLTDQKLNQDIKSSMSNLSEVTKKLNNLIDENRNSLKRLTSNSVELTQDAKEFFKTNKEKINSSIDELQSVLKNSDSLLVKLNKFTGDMNTKQNNLGKIMYDEKIYNDLTQSLNQLNELTKLMLDQLKGEGLNIDAHIF